MVATGAGIISLPLGLSGIRLSAMHRSDLIDAAALITLTAIIVWAWRWERKTLLDERRKW